MFDCDLIEFLCSCVYVTAMVHCIPRGAKNVPKFA